MYLYPSDKHTSSALEAVTTNGVSLIRFDHANNVFRFLTNALVKNLEMGKTNLVLVNNEEQLDRIPKLLANHKLANICLAIRDNSQMNEKDLTRLKVLAKNTQQKDLSKLFDVCRSQLTNSMQSINRRYDFLTKPIFGERSWKDLTYKGKKFAQSQRALMLKRKINSNNIPFDQKTYWFFRGRVEEAAKCYKKEFDLLEKLDTLHPKNYQGDRNEWILSQISKFKTELTLLLQQYSKFIETFSNTYFEQGLAEIEDLTIIINILDRKLNAFKVKYLTDESIEMSHLQEKIKSKFDKSFRAKIEARSDLQELNQQLKSLFEKSDKFSFSIEPIELEDQHIEHIELTIEKAKKCIDSWRSSIYFYKEDKLKHLNNINADHNELQGYEAKLQETLNGVNVSKIFNEPVEDNTFNLLAKFNFIQQLVDELSNAEWLLREHIDYLFFRDLSNSFTQELTELIEGLKQFSTQYWIEVYDQFFFNELIHRHYHPQAPMSNMTFANLHHDLEEYRRVLSQFITSKWAENRTKSLSKLSKINKKYYTSFFKKSKGQGTNWISVLSMEPDFCMDFYPIMIMTKSKFESLDKTNLHWDTTFIETHDSTIIEELANLKYCNSLCYISEGNISQKNIKTIEDSPRAPHFNQHHLTQDYTVSITPFALMNTAEKLPAAKRMANRITSITQNYKVYQLRDTSIISLACEDLNKELLDLLDLQGIKELFGPEDTSQKLIDVLIDTDKKLLILTEDGLINPDSIEDCEWQQLVIKQFEQMGAKWLNIWTVDRILKKQSSLAQEISKHIQLENIEEEVLLHA